MKEKTLLKKVIALLMTTVLIFGMVNMALATDRVQYSSEKDFEYVTGIIPEGISQYDEGTEVAVITDYVGNGGDVVIPETLGGYPVGGIDNLAFSVLDENGEFDKNSEANNIKSVVIPDTVVVIGEGAFIRFGATNTISPFLTGIYGKQIENCEIEITVPSTVEYIGFCAFGCITVVEFNNTTVKDTPQQIIHYEGTAEKWDSICDKTDIGDMLRQEINIPTFGTVVFDFVENLRFTYVTPTVDETSVEITNTPAASLYIGQQHKLTATVYPSTATNKGVTWSSSNPGVIAIDQNGNMTARAKGSAVITATTVNKGVTDTCVIFVDEKIYHTIPRYELSSETAGAGETVTVYLSIKNNPGIVSLKNSVSYDQSVFTLESVTNLEKLGGFVTPAPNKKSPYTLMWEDATAPADNTVNGDIVALTFTVSEDAAAGEYDISVAHIESYNQKLEKVEFEDTATTITVVKHTYKTLPSVVPTCTQTGLTEGLQCSVCNKIIVPQTVIPALGHTPDEGRITEAPTCTSSGTKTYYCTVCDAVAKTETIPALGHTPDEGHITEAPTCTSSGINTYYCTVCDAVAETETVYALGHTPDEGRITEAPTCTVSGTKTYYCTVCDVVVSTATVPALGHTPDEGLITKIPTCTDFGIKTVFCETCNVSLQTVKLDATGHKDEDSNNYCDICDEKIDPSIPDEEEPSVPDKPETTEATYTLSTEGIAAPGQKITVYLSIENNPGIIALKNSVSYDSSVFTLESVENLDVLNGFIQPSPDTNSPYILAWSHGTATENNTSEGQIAALTFTVNEDAPVGDYEFSVTHTEGWSYDFESISFENASATVSVINVDKGDVNADGNTDLRDSVLLARYLANWKVEIVSFASDIDEDGEVTDRDSILLNRYLAGWNVEEMKKTSSDQ